MKFILHTTTVMIIGNGQYQRWAASNFSLSYSMIALQTCTTYNKYSLIGQSISLVLKLEENPKGKIKIRKRKKRTKGKENNLFVFWVLIKLNMPTCKSRKKSKKKKNKKEEYRNR